MLTRAGEGVQEEQERMAVVLNAFKRALSKCEGDLAESKKQYNS